jgi:hypothetical protein
MYNNIIVFSSIIGSVYIYSNTLRLINATNFENQHLHPCIKIINGATFVVSGSIFLYGSFKALMILSRDNKNE